jgi:hypothetical protein
MCFVHVLLNAFDFKQKGYAVTIVVEGSACKLVKDLAEETNPFHAMWEQAKNDSLISAVCRACCIKMNSIESAQSQGLPLEADMKGHVALEKYIKAGFTLITF